MTDTIIAAETVLTGAEAIHDGAVLVRGDTIAGVGPLPEIHRMAGDQAMTRRYPGATLLPGLIDAHVRLVLDGAETPYQDFHRLDLSSEDQRRGYLAGEMSHRAQQTLTAGITTVRDIGDSHHLSVQLAAEIAAGHVVGPRIVAAGPPLTTEGGDGSFLGGVVVDEADIREAVAARAVAGASLICYHDSGGFLKLAPRTPPFSWNTQFTPDQVQTIVDEAHRHDLPVAAHVFSKDGIAHAVDADVDTVEHCYWTVGPQRYDRDPAVADTMAEHGIFACLPTNANRAHGQAQVGEEKAIELWYSRFSWLDQRGVRLIAGSGAGGKTSPHGDPVSVLETYEWLGFPRDMILQLATGNAAEALGLGKVTGSLLPGYSADLLVVDGNPLEDLQALRRPLLVMANGRIAEAQPEPQKP